MRCAPDRVTSYHIQRICMCARQGRSVSGQRHSKRAHTPCAIQGRSVSGQRHSTSAFAVRQTGSQHIRVAEFNARSFAVLQTGLRHIRSVTFNARAFAVRQTESQHIRVAAFNARMRCAPDGTTLKDAQPGGTVSLVPPLSTSSSCTVSCKHWRRRAYCKYDLRDLSFFIL